MRISFMLITLLYCHTNLCAADFDFDKIKKANSPAKKTVNIDGVVDRIDGASSYLEYHANPPPRVLQRFHPRIVTAFSKPSYIAN